MKVCSAAKHVLPQHVAGFAKRGLIHMQLSNFPTFTIHTFRLEKAIDLKFGQG